MLRERLGHFVSHLDSSFAVFLGLLHEIAIDILTEKLNIFEHIGRPRKLSSPYLILEHLECLILACPCMNQDIDNSVFDSNYSLFIGLLLFLDYFRELFEEVSSNISSSEESSLLLEAKVGYFGWWPVVNFSKVVLHPAHYEFDLLLRFHSGGYSATFAVLPLR